MRPRPLRISAVLLVTLVATTSAAPEVTPTTSSQAVARVKALLLLNRAAYGPRPGDVEHLLEVGPDAWLEQQFYPAAINDNGPAAKLARLEQLRLSPSAILAKYPRPTGSERVALAEVRKARDAGEVPQLDPDMRERLGDRERPATLLAELGQAKLIRAVESERQLAEVMTDFWFNHFNVYARKNRETLLLLPDFEKTAIRAHALGNFADLLIATAQSPAMLIYLDNWVNAKAGFDPRAERRGFFGGKRRRPPAMAERAEPPRPQRTRGVNENYARELMELHTLGVDGGYTQLDVIELARCLTGWTVIDPAKIGRGKMGAAAIDGDFHFVAAMHDPAPKTVLGRHIIAGGVDDGLQALRLLAGHPATAHFISTKLAKRFVSDDPSSELVAEMATAWIDSKGDIRTVLKAMFGSSRFVPEATMANKVKTPLELLVSSIRATGAELSDARDALNRLEALGQPLYLCQPPTGFDEAAATWLTAGSMLNRLRLVGEIVGGTVIGIRTPKVPADFALVLASPTFQRQ